MRLVDKMVVLRLAFLAAVLQHLAPAAILQAFMLYLLPAKDKAVGAAVQLSRDTQMT